MPGPLVLRGGAGFEEVREGESRTRPAVGRAAHVPSVMIREWAHEVAALTNWPE